MFVHSFPVFELFGKLVLLFALMMAVPLAFAVGQHDEAEQAFVIGIAVTALAGVVMILMTHHIRRELRPRDGFVLVVLAWALLPAFAAVPLKLAVPDMSITDAYFEAMSGFTTTGATVLTGLDQLPLSVNVWRCLLSLIGGLGFIVLAIAVLPLLGVGGARLFKAEAAGPMKEQKLTPRIAATARGLWLVYFAAALTFTLAYRLAGMAPAPRGSCRRRGPRTTSGLAPRATGNVRQLPMYSCRTPRRRTNGRFQRLLPFNRHTRPAADSLEEPLGPADPRTAHGRPL